MALSQRLKYMHAGFLYDSCTKPACMIFTSLHVNNASITHVVI